MKIKGVDILMVNIEDIKKDIVQRSVESLGNIINDIILFGSYARGDFDQESDVDVMILLDCSQQDLPKYRNQLTLISSDISLDDNITVSFVVRDKDTFYNKMSILPFYQNVQKDGVILYERE